MHLCQGARFVTGKTVGKAVNWVMWRSGCGRRGSVAQKSAAHGGHGTRGVGVRAPHRLVAAAPLEQGEVVIPWLDQPAAVPPPAQGVIGQQLVWEELDSWIT